MMIQTAKQPLEIKPLKTKFQAFLIIYIENVKLNNNLIILDKNGTYLRNHGYW